LKQKEKKYPDDVKLAKMRAGMKAIYRANEEMRDPRTGETPLARARRMAAENPDKYD